VNNKLQRKRIVSFRATAEEYDSLQRSSINSGARSVSEFARSVACQEAPEEKHTPNPAKLDALLTNIHETVASMEQKLEHITEILVKKDA
jgi:hypothetical protein